ncbi:MAG TPA: hypothetical protein PK816_13180 [Candidatus Cloacimonadota bacterium]|nr:hypothetical protein [Candidatus Cloacimonadota bacterium]
MKKDSNSSYQFLNKTSSLLVFLFIMFTLFFTACTPKTAGLAVKHPKKLLLARDELKRWQTFQMEGLAEVQFKMFVFRKNFVLNKSREAVRFDMLDSGVFGMGASNISVYMDSTMQVNAMWGKQSLDMNAPDEIRDIYKWFNEADVDDLNLYLQDIVEYNEFTKDGIRFVFNHQMRLKLITVEDIKIRLEFSYDYGSNLSEINVWLANLKICNFKIDKISYNNISVTKLR